MSQDINKLLTAVAYGEHDDIIRILEHVDCSLVDARGQNLLFPAIAKRRGLTGLLLDRGAGINQQNIDGNTPLHLAATNMDIESARILLKRGADVRLTNKFGNQPLWSGLMEAIKVVNTPHGYELLSLLIAHGSDPDHCNHAGMSPRMFVARNSDDSIIRRMFLEGL